jgi:hypothetical protein
MTMLGRVVLDGWLFGHIPEEDCAGWDLARMQNLMNQNEVQMGSVRQPAQSFAGRTAPASRQVVCLGHRARPERGWDPELGEDE